MKIEILSIPDCPNHLPALQLVQEVVAEVGLHAEVREIIVRDARDGELLCFAGSPTVRVNGIDVEPPPLFALPVFSCRIYSGNRGLPERDSIRRALQHAKREGN